MSLLAQPVLQPAPSVAHAVGFAGLRTDGSFTAGGLVSAGGVYSVTARLASFTYPVVSGRIAAFTYPAVSPPVQAPGLIGHAGPKIESARLEVPALVSSLLASHTGRSSLGRRSLELAWRKDNADYLRRTFPGQWVVLERDRIVASGSDPVEIVKTARRKGIRSPYLFRVEERIRPRTSSLGL